MEERPAQRPDVPWVWFNGPTLSANISIVQFNPGNGGITLAVGDQRNGPVERVGDAAQPVNYEIGRFQLTPRALRMLIQSAQIAERAYADTTENQLPTLEAFDARAHMPALENLLQPPKRDDDGASG